MHRQPPAPTKIRWLILGLLFAISVVTYIDRVNISVTARQMMPAFGLTDQQMGLVFSSFFIGYAIFQIPGGWLGDRMGARRVLVAALLWWSAFSAMTAVAATLPIVEVIGITGALVLTRFLLGMGEAVALPTFNRAVTDWLPASERGFGISLAIGGIGLGSAITPPLAAWLMVNYGWQTVFFLSAALGLGLAVIWWLFARDRVDQHPWTNEEERRLVRPLMTPATQPMQTVPVPWRRLFDTPSLRWLVLSYSCFGYAASFYMSWFYLYLVNVQGFSTLQGGLYATGPYLAMLFFCPLGGWVTDRLAAHYGVAKGRVWTGMAGMVLAGLTIAAASRVNHAFLAVAALSLGAGWLYFSLGAYWASTGDLSKHHAGILSGIMNTGANLGGTLSPWLTPWLAEQWGWPVALGAASLTAICGGLMWVWINPAKGLANGSTS
jgi:MFS transporter, ACS family, glucarate transporter